MAISVDANETAITLWVAFCSNRTRPLDDCLQKTRETIGLGDTGLMAEWAGRELHTIYLNRGRDTAFLERLFAEDNPELALGCVRAALDARLQGDSVEIEPYFSGYAARYGEDAALLAMRLRWLTLYANYQEHSGEVERIMGILQPASGKEA